MLHKVLDLITLVTLQLQLLQCAKLQIPARASHPQLTASALCLQTETGMIMIAAMPGAWPLKPGCATLPMFGVLPILLDSNGKEIRGPGEGVLVLKQVFNLMGCSLYHLLRAWLL